MNELLKSALVAPPRPSMLYSNPEYVRMVSELAACQRGRAVIEHHVYPAAQTSDQYGQLWKLEDGECLMVLIEHGAIVYWQPWRAPLHVFERCVTDWVSDTRSRQAH